MSLQDWCWHLGKSPFHFKKTMKLSYGKKKPYLVWSVISIDTGFTIDSHGILQAIDANSSSSVLSSNIQTFLLIGNTFIIVAVFRFIVAITF